MERTLVIVKPDAFEKGATGKIIDRFISEGFRIRALKLFRFTKEQAEGFYAVHRERPFFGELVEFMTSGPVVAMVLEGEDAIRRVREIIGPTDSNEARKVAPNSIRALFGTDKGKNAVHASDSKESADYEIPFIFSQLEMA
ncbi:MAG: nucleoside-diphosphate kinase [Aquificota bacterium]|jgi:nucleoside-diphosphate kinase|uniref:Nucleoside diphosphate kinase n=1 Tax=Hydrogenobacter sp. TaxID=2152829 RepID=A0A7C2ZND7_9AQUI|nr:nucleoside-diphosphate kinase [Aquificaceae bacterium]MDM7267124.1 nucleoside-diphosphate kinase [Aquificaceae bacterium]QWK12733.1 MAG: nucleoside-diphosphate kinase [Aquificota bacterium]HCO39781.1 nucleoside-diphosphate kinase [Aquificaceae bacterium]